jgi:hypothetical protein
MTITGEIKKYDGKQLIISAPFSDTDLLIDRQIKDCEIILSDGRTITEKQRKFIFAMLRDISFYSGHEIAFLEDYFKAEYVARTGGEWFSLSDCSMTKANELIEIIIEYCIEWYIPTKSSLLMFAPDLSRYLYWCLKNKVCCITRQPKAELHHAEDHVGMGRNRKEIIHTGMRVMPLTRLMHTEVHRIGQQTFNEKYHIHGIEINEELCKVWGVKYE